MPREELRDGLIAPFEGNSKCCLLTTSDFLTPSPVSVSPQEMRLPREEKETTESEKVTRLSQEARSEVGRSLLQSQTLSWNQTKKRGGKEGGGGVIGSGSCRNSEQA